ncbi:MAG: integration host factor, actinobacterial type [Alistipes inops]
MNNNHLPELTDEQRRVASERAVEARRAQAKLKELVRKGEITFDDALDDERAKRIRVRKLLMCVPGIGKTKTDNIMRASRIPENRRVQGLGRVQRKIISIAVDINKYKYK